MKLNTLSIFLSLLFISPLFAQDSPRFKAGLLAGLNFAELTGDGTADYQGLNTGMIASARLNKGLQMSMELLFSQNGEYILPEYYPRINYGKITLNHIEVPVHLDVLIKTFQGREFEDWQLHFGAAYTRLFSHFAENDEGIEITEQIIYDDRTAFQGQVGTTYFFSKNMGLNLKASLPLRRDELAWTLTARLVYVFNLAA